MRGPHGEHDEPSTLGLAHDPRATQDGLSLRIVEESLVRSQALPASGSLVIGRSRECDVRVDHASISRRHAVLHLGATLAVEDLGSANGTRVGDRALAPNETRAIAPGDVIEVGSVMLIVQRGRHARREAPSSPASSNSNDRLIERIAASTINVLLLGETGVGKEVMAETIHQRSPRAKKNLLRLNCATFSEGLLASELFGHEKGAFSGADQTKPGLLETANGGSVFLDEIGELPMPLQAKLLRVLEERMVMRVGGLQPRAIDARFIAASNRDLEEEIAQGRFRQDLYFRLSGFTIVIPPLRERRAEIEPLARLFLDRASRAAGRPRTPALANETLEHLLAYAWPGNVRELKNAMERALVLATGDVILPEHVPLRPRMHSPSAPPPPPAPPPLASSDAALRAELDRLERERVMDALARAAGNQTQAAKLLGVSRSTLLARLEAYGLPRPRKR